MTSEKPSETAARNFADFAEDCLMISSPPADFLLWNGTLSLGFVREGAMSRGTASCQEVYSRVLRHLLRCVEGSPAINEPFSHVFLEDVFPDAVYRQLLDALPHPDLYDRTAERHHGDAEGNYVRRMFPITAANLARLSPDQDALLRGVAAALTAPEVKQAMYAKLCRDLAYRYGVAESQADRLAGHSRPTLYRETEGFEIPPHPDTRRKVVTMHLYLPADRSQVGLGTALYQRKLFALPFGPWRRRFAKVKQFPFLPNSGYAFVVNNTMARRSWHGREQLPPGAGVRNSLLNTFYETPRAEFQGYLACQPELTADSPYAAGAAR